MPRNPPPVAPVVPPATREAARPLYFNAPDDAGPRFFAKMTRGSWFADQKPSAVPENKRSAAP